MKDEENGQAVGNENCEGSAVDGHLSQPPHTQASGNVSKVGSEKKKNNLSAGECREEPWLLLALTHSSCGHLCKIH